MIITSTVSPSLEIGLRFLGLWPNAHYSVLYQFIYLSTILIMQYFQYLYVINHFELSELSNLVDGLPAALDYTLTMLKLLTLWANRRVIYQLLAAIDKDWRECISVQQHWYLMTMRASVSHFISKAMFSFCTISGILYILGEYAVDFLVQRNDTSRHFPIKLQFPNQAEQSPIFELLIVILFMHIMCNIYVVGFVNVLIFTLVLHASGQIDILCQDFKTICGETSHFKSFQPTIKMLVERHNRIISFSNNIHKLYSFMALMQILWNTLVICCIGFFFMISVHNGTEVMLFIKACFACAVIITEIFMFCFAGEYLTHKSKSITEAAYGSLWYDLPMNQGKIMILIIMRSQRQLMLTAGGIANLSLETFASVSFVPSTLTIMKASASYVSVLLAMY